MPALLFDLDGTMLNSDPIHLQVYKEMWAARGMELADAEYMTHMHGRLNVDIYAEFLPDEPDHQGLADWKEAQFRARLPRPYPAMPGVEALVAQAVAEGPAGHGYDAATGSFGDMYAAGIIDPARVPASALVNAASVATLILTTETLVGDLEEGEADPTEGPARGGGAELLGRA